MFANDRISFISFSWHEHERSSPRCVIDWSINQKHSSFLSISTSHLTVSYCAILNLSRQQISMWRWTIVWQCDLSFVEERSPLMVIMHDEVDVLISSMHESPVVLTFSLSNCFFFHGISCLSFSLSLSGLSSPVICHSSNLLTRWTNWNNIPTPVRWTQERRWSRRAANERTPQHR